MSGLDIDNLLGMYGEASPTGASPQNDDDDDSEGSAEEYDVGDEDTGDYDGRLEQETPPPEDDDDEEDEDNDEEEDQDDEEEDEDQDDENPEEDEEDDDEEEDQDDDGSESRHDEDEEEDEESASVSRRDDEEETQSVVSSSRRSTSRTDALFEHANWKERKLEEKRAFEASKLTFAPKTNTSKYHNSASVSSMSRLSAHERLYQHGQRKRDASLTAKRREIDEREIYGTFSKSNYNKPGHDKLNSRVPPKMAWDNGSNNHGGGGDNSLNNGHHGNGDRTWGDVIDDQSNGYDNNGNVNGSLNDGGGGGGSMGGGSGRPKLWDRSRPRSASSNNVNGHGGDRSARSASASSARSSTRRTDALYLESILRQQRREAKLRDLEDEHSFQPDLSRGRSLYREPYEKMDNGHGGRGASVHDRLYDDGSRKREFTQDVVAKVYSRSRVARNRRMVDYALNGGDDNDDGTGDHPRLDANGDFMDEFGETRSVGGYSSRSGTGGGGGGSTYGYGGRSTRSTSTHTQRTDALYLEATLRRARKEEKAAQKHPEHTFAPATNTNGALPRYNDKSGRQRSASVNNVGQYRSLSETSGVSRHDLLYLDGERKRQRNIDARFDPHQKGTGELVEMYNTKWHSSARLKNFNPNLMSKQEEQLQRRYSLGGGGRGGGSGDPHETRSLDGFSVGTDLTGASGRSHTRRTEALYLEASLRAARKEAMREAYADHGFTFQPQVKAQGTSRWVGQTKSLNNVVSRLYNPQAAAEEKQEKEAKKKAFELRDFVGTPQIKVVQGKSRALEQDPFERLHINAEAKAQAIKDKAASLLVSEQKVATFSPILAAKGSEKQRSRSASRTRTDDWTPKITSNSKALSYARRSSSSSSSAPLTPSSPPTASSFASSRSGGNNSSSNRRASAPGGSSTSATTTTTPRFDPKTGRLITAQTEEAEAEKAIPPPLTALERFRLRQAERAKKREEEERANAAAAASAAAAAQKSRYSSPTRKGNAEGSNPLHSNLSADEVESY